MENSSIEQEIAQLEQQLADKRSALGIESSEKSESFPQDREILRQVVGEKIKEHAPEYQPAPAQQNDDDQSSYNDPQIVAQVQELVDLAFSKSMDDAIKSVVQSGNPALIDAFHDVLVDKLYDTLVERKKLEEVK
ncbi:MAG: hypothetical protein WD989_00345 [Candidatus Paceibacterota bacterium]